MLKPKMSSVHALLVKQEVPAFSCLWLIGIRRFLRKGVSSDAERNGEVQNGFTSCFARQTGSAHIFLPVIDWFMLFSQREGFSGCGTLWWNPKCRHFLFCSPTKKCQYFPAYNWLIHAVFSGRGFFNPAVLFKTCFSHFKYCNVNKGYPMFLIHPKLGQLLLN